MGKMKLYELAKEMDISSKDLLEQAKTLGMSIKSHLSAISDEDAEKLRTIAEKKPFVKKEENCLENFYINRFGRKLYSMFFSSNNPFRIIGKIFNRASA